MRPGWKKEQECNKGANIKRTERGLAKIKFKRVNSQENELNIRGQKNEGRITIDIIVTKKSRTVQCSSAQSCLFKR